MPRYDYDCASCGQRSEVIHGVHADAPAACPSCGGGPLRKAFATPAIHFKGSGWAKKERRATAVSSTKSGADGTDTGDGADPKDRAAVGPADAGGSPSKEPGGDVPATTASGSSGSAAPATPTAASSAGPTSD